MSTALNVAVEDTTGSRARRAARQALEPFQQKVDAKILDHQMTGLKHLRQVQTEMTAECAQAIHRLRSPKSRPREPLTIPVPAEERAKEDLAAAIREAETVARETRLHEFKARPFVAVDGVTLRDIAVLPKRTFDGAVFNYSPGGGALRQLEAMRPADRREVLRFMTAAWQGETYNAGAETIVAPNTSCLWLCDSGDFVRLGRNPAVSSSGLLETFLIVCDDGTSDVDIEALAETEVDDAWRTLVKVVLSERIMGEACEHQLAQPAVDRFLTFHSDTLRRHSTPGHKFTSWWPEQVLKIALLLHLDTPGSEVPTEINLAVIEHAITIFAPLGDEQLRVAESLTSRSDDFETQIEIMVAKVRTNGPMPKWNLFRRYHVQRAEVMEPILARCCERNLLQVENDFVRLTDVAQ